VGRTTPQYGGSILHSLGDGGFLAPPFLLVHPRGWTHLSPSASASFPSSPPNPYCDSIVPSVLLAIIAAWTCLPVPPATESIGNKLHTCTGCHQGFCLKDRRLEGRFATTGFEGLQPCRSTYHAECFQVGPPRKGGKGLALLSSCFGLASLHL
jgi:hypothetical protein